MTRTACKIDANQPDIVAALRRMGAHATSTAAVGKGFPDIVVAYQPPHKGRAVWTPMEIKVPGCKLNQDQEDFHAACPAPIPVVYSELEATLAIAELARPVLCAKCGAAARREGR